MNISVIVTTKNEERNIVRCLESIRHQTYKEKEILVIDNNSTDKTKELAQKYTNKVYNKGPERSAQRNFGIAKSTGSLILILDADMELTAGLLQECVNTIKKKNDALIIPEKFIAKGYWSKCKALEKSAYGGTDEAQAARFFKKSVLQDLGGYDEKLTGPEDIDLHKRVVRAGYTIGRVHAQIKHHDEYLSLISLIKKRWYYSQNLRTYLNKHKEEGKKEMQFIRPAFVKNWRLFAADPAHACGFILLRVLEGIAVLFALTQQKKN